MKVRFRLADPRRWVILHEDGWFLMASDGVFPLELSGRRKRGGGVAIKSVLAWSEALRGLCRFPVGQVVRAGDPLSRQTCDGSGWLRLLLEQAGAPISDDAPPPEWQPADAESAGALS